MDKEIEKIEVRQRFGGGKDVDIIYTDGTKKRIDKKRLLKRKKVIQGRINNQKHKLTKINSELDVYKENINQE